MEGSSMVISRFWLAAASVLTVLDEARAEEPIYTFSLTTGAGQPVCETLLAEALAAAAEVIGECELYEPEIQETPVLYIRWDLLRDQLAPTFGVPEWRDLDLSNSRDFEEAIFSVAATDAHAVDTSSVTGGVAWQ
jgi:hypothetical protein